MVLPFIALKGLNAVTPLSLWMGPGFVFASWCLMAAACLAYFARLLSKLDLEKTVLVIEPEGVTFFSFGTKTLRWASISKIKFQETGQFWQTKTVALYLVEGGYAILPLNHMADISPRYLFETLRAYHRKFGPMPVETIGKSHDSAAWTGVDDE